MNFRALWSVLSGTSAEQREQKMQHYYQNGRRHALAVLQDAGGDNAAEACRGLSIAADGQFNTTEWESEFDRGIKAVVFETLQDLGAPWHDQHTKNY